MRERLSPNHTARTRPIRCVILHADASASASGTLDWLTSPESAVSYHVLVDRDGTATRLVPDDRVAWHAGKAEWERIPFVNAISLGLSFANRNDGKEPYTQAQLDTARGIVAGWCRAYNIPVAHITTHAAVARPVGRKDDPRAFPLDPFRASVAAILGAAP